MKTYIVHIGEYMGDGVDMHAIKARNDQEAIAVALKLDEENLTAELEDGEKFSWDKAIQDAEESNGDGQAWVTIFDVRAEKVIFGGDES
jgi:hypothetical protein